MYEYDVNKLEYDSVKEKVLRDSIDIIDKQIKHYEQILVKKRQFKFMYV